VWLVDPRRWARLVGIGMVVAVIAQGVLGGMTVLYGLPAYVSSAHGILGQTFFALTCLMAYAQSQELENRLTDAEERSGDRRAFQCGLALLVLLYAQLTLGAFMRHTESGLALTDFPTFDGSLSLDFNAERLHEINQSRQQLGMVPVELYQVLLHAAHRIGGIVVFGAVLLLTLWAARRTVLSAQAKTAARFLWLLVCAQLMLGIFTVLSLRNPMLTSLHVAVGAVMIGMTLLFVMRSFPIVEEK
jgi:heme A synthase